MHMQTRIEPIGHKHNRLCVCVCLHDAIIVQSINMFNNMRETEMQRIKLHFGISGLCTHKLKTANYARERESSRTVLSARDGQKRTKHFKPIALQQQICSRHSNIHPHKTAIINITLSTSARALWKERERWRTRFAFDVLSSVFCSRRAFFGSWVDGGPRLEYGRELIDFL